MTFTPGPWVVHPKWPGIVVPLADAGKKIGGSCDPDREAAEYAKQIVSYLQISDEYPAFYRSRLSLSEARANARLIASAPELLAAMQDVLAQFNAGYFVRNTDADGCSDWAIKAIEPLRALAAAKRAIAKAEGRSAVEADAKTEAR